MKLIVLLLAAIAGTASAQTIQPARGTVYCAAKVLRAKADTGKPCDFRVPGGGIGSPGVYDDGKDVLYLRPSTPGMYGVARIVCHPPEWQGGLPGVGAAACSTTAANNPTPQPKDKTPPEITLGDRLTPLTIDGRLVWRLPIQVVDPSGSHAGHPFFYAGQGVQRVSITWDGVAMDSYRFPAANVVEASDFIFLLQKDGVPYTAPPGTTQHMLKVTAVDGAGNKVRGSALVTVESP